MMQYKGYVGKIEFDANARILHGEVIGIRDVVTFQGTSVEEIEKAFHESVDDYLSFCKERGEQPNKPFSGQFLLRVNPELHRNLDMFAHASGKSLNSFVAECLSHDIENLNSPTISSKAGKNPRKFGRKSGVSGGKRATYRNAHRKAVTA
jgi:predicted HicB family RNase H-like nuclease